MTETRPGGALPPECNRSETKPESGGSDSFWDIIVSQPNDEFLRAAITSFRSGDDERLSKERQQKASPSLPKTLTQQSYESFEALNLVFLQLLQDSQGAEVCLQKLSNNIESPHSSSYVITKRIYGYQHGGYKTGCWVHPHTTEADAFRRLPEHPNIVRCLGCYGGAKKTDGSKPENTLLLEVCWGGSLDAFIHFAEFYDLHIPEVFIWKVMLETITALAVCVTRGGLLHFDVHPRNIFLQIPQAPSDPKEAFAWPVVKLAGFGLARRTKDKDGHKWLDVAQLYLVLRQLMHTKKHACWKPEDYWSATLLDWLRKLKTYLSLGPHAADLLTSFRPVALRHIEEEEIPGWFSEYFENSGLRAFVVDNDV